MKKILYISGLLLASCSLNHTAHDNTVPSIVEQDYNTGFVVPDAVPVLSAAETKVNTAVSLFGLDVFDQILADNNNESFMFSPLSLSMALSMCLGGAEGETEAQLAALLGFEGKSSEDITSYYTKMLGRLKTVDESVMFHTANALWYDEAFPIKNSYLSSLGTSFDASAFKMHFDDRKSLTESINKWVSEKTFGTIKEMVSKAPDKPMALVNAAYFKADWAVKTMDQLVASVFKGANGSVATDYFCASTDFDYVEKEDYQLLAIPYGQSETGDRFEMVIVLPEDKVNAKQLLTNKGEELLHSMDAVEKVQLTAYIPCFKIENTLTDLQSILSKKYPLPFSADSDFSGISDEPLFISRITQKCCINVDEKGSEASSATLIDMETSTGQETATKVFKADRPFVFFIRENGSGSIVFMGIKQ